MDSLHLLYLHAEIHSEHCQLNHGPGIDTDGIAAVDYIVVPVGFRESADCDRVIREMVVPVCSDCIQALQGEEWTLLYCLDCGESHWVCRQWSKNRYRHHILWLKRCPGCSDVFGGLYFNDLSTNIKIPEQSAHKYSVRFLLDRVGVNGSTVE